MSRQWFEWTGRRSPALTDAGLLLLRVFAGTWLVYAHGWGKLANFGEKSATFGDPLGVGSAASLALITFAEFFCAILVGLGLLTRFAALSIVIGMGVAAFVVHGADPFVKKELALLYLTVYAALALTGPGRWSVDAALWRRRA